jgi:predicted polyphosphate/ATP-dependent NAD kinase
MNSRNLPATASGNPSPHQAGPGKRLGLIVNPIAGMGGRVGLKGTDGSAVLDEAKRLGAQPVSSARALQALHKLTASAAEFSLVTGQGDLGEDVARLAGLHPQVVYGQLHPTSTSEDTQGAVAAMIAAGVDLLIFAGGDGTARDVLGVVGERVPVLGIPTGVKMYSAVFGTNAKNAGDLAARFIKGDPSVRLRESEVMDIDEVAMREDRMTARLYGYALSPHHRQLTQNAKAGSGFSENVALEAVSRQLAREMRPGCLYIVGPGTTTRRVMSALGLPKTLLGVDAVLDGELVGADLNEQALLQLMQGRETYIVVSVLGGHGSLFGRGNQQISAEVIRQVGRGHIQIITTLEKLIALDAGALHVDTGDEEIDAMLSGYMPLHTAPDRKVYFKVTS